MSDPGTNLLTCLLCFLLTLGLALVGGYWWQWAAAGACGLCVVVAFLRAAMSEPPK